MVKCKNTTSNNQTRFAPWPLVKYVAAAYHTTVYCDIVGDAAGQGPTL